MKEIKGLDLNVYQKKLNNGLEIIVIPNNKVNNCYVTYSTRYGGIDNEFYINNKLIKVPMGIAHFLEHKMFEMADGSDVFNFFAERGSNCNANTNSKKTTYLFSGPNSFYDNLEYLLKYVEEPYFTDANVEKEKGIINQEIMMYKDNPYSRLYDEIMFNTFINHPLKYPTIGTSESINKITKEDLYNCYNTFYNPSNMFIIVTGNVDYEKTFEVIENIENKRNIKKNDIIKRKSYKEPDNVCNEYKEIKMDVTIPKVAITFKINISSIKKMDIKEIYGHIVNMFDLKLGSTSLFTENLRKEGLITDTFDTSVIKADDHFIVIIDFETVNTDEVIKKVLDEVKDLNITEEEFERRKKCGISSLLLASDNIFKLNSKIMNEIIEYNSINYDPINTIKNYSYKNIKNINKIINLDNYSIIKILPKNDCKCS